MLFDVGCDTGLLQASQMWLRCNAMQNIFLTDVAFTLTSISFDDKLKLPFDTHLSVNDS